MGYVIDPDGRLDRTHQWQNNDDRVAYDRAFKVGDQEEIQMAIAQYCADPATPEGKIRAMMTNPSMPPRTGYDRTEPTIESALAVRSPRGRLLFDKVGPTSTSRPSLGKW